MMPISTAMKKWFSTSYSSPKAKSTAGPVIQPASLKADVKTALPANTSRKMRAPTALISSVNCCHAAVELTVLVLRVETVVSFERWAGAVVVGWWVGGAAGVVLV